ncbi:MAG: hypothetical protein IPL26_18825 [Leptospiraceae bacterium]|nr:hypothetical protein [Leptospiraceae bacterium]
MEESKLTKIIVWNIVIYFLLCILCIGIPKIFLSSSAKDYLPLAFMILCMISLGLQVLINFFLCGYYYLSGKKDLGLSFFISPLILLIIGVPICYSPFILSK